MNEECEKILQSLEYAYSGAKMMNDYETQLRISRAINAFQLWNAQRIKIKLKGEK